LSFFSALSYPQNVTAHSTSATTVVVNWALVFAQDINASLRYLAQWVEVANGEKNVTVSSSPHAITGLKMSSEYRICVTTVEHRVITECSDEVLVRTQGNYYRIRHENFTAKGPFRRYGGHFEFYYGMLRAQISMYLLYIMNVISIQNQSQFVSLLFISF